ncbi:hypothetical protein GCM10010324_11600 [Streptomyces hiroshimensis]|uniref:Uncharacterized protein n=1 Tax=Streptomyces hiroshimensis TaxID=66424 RepID=A0ABQ2Y8I9_9ACTN|nr:hypothetical protein GCM10010324_11600 [Streptomyces hiroshimensis]
MVSSLTEVPLAGTSSRTVIEYETLGAVAMADFLCFPLFRWCAHRRAGGTPTEGAQVTIVPPTDW